MFGKSLSLRWRMALIILGPLLVLAPVFVQVGYEYRKAYRDGYLRQAILAARQIEQTVGTVAPFISSIYDAPGLSSYIQDVAQTGEVFSFAALVLDTGTVVYHSLPALNGQFVNELTNLTVGEGIRRSVSPYGPLYLVVQAVPLPGAEDAAGRQLYIVIGEPAAVVDPPFLVFLPVVGGALITVILLVLILYVMERLILRPLQQLAEGAALIGAGDLAYEIPLQRSDEIGFLARAFNEMGARLQSMVVGLEKQVAERTTALQRQTKLLRAAGLVSREAVQVRDVQAFLATTVRAISEYFDFYHAGIFLLDENKEWAVLRVASSEGGQQMLARGHRLRTGTGIVGFVAATGRARIALDVGGDTVWVKNPDLPATRSEMALPLKVGNEVLGVLDVQSVEPGAFTDEDIKTLEVMADQLAVALQNVRLLEQTRATVSELESLYQDYGRQGWARVRARMQTLAYEYDRVELRPVPPLPVPPDLREGNVPYAFVRDGGQPVLMEPLRVNEQIIGLMALSDPDRSWTEDELALIQGVGEQVGLAVENARLVEETQRTARRQTLLSNVLQSAATSTSPEAALQQIARILAGSLDMAVGLFTFVDPQATQVRPQAFVTPEGESIVLITERVSLPPELQIFFRGLVRPELARMFDTLAQQALFAQAEVFHQYETGRVLYVSMGAANELTGFMALVQRKDTPPIDPETRDLVQDLGRQIAIVLQNMNLLVETQQRSNELRILYDVSLRLSESLEPERLLELLVEQALLLFNADAGGFFVLDPAAGELIFSHCRGYFAPFEGARMKPGEGAAGRAFQQRKPIVVEDYQAWPGRSSMFDIPQLRSVMAVPLLGLGGVAGVLNLGGGETRPVFTERELRLAELFAAQAAAALDNARLYQETTRNAESLQKLYDAGLDLVTLLDVDSVLDRGADWVCRLLDATIASVYLKGEGENEFKIGRGARTPEWRTRNLYPMPRSSGLTHTIIQTGMPIIIRDGRQDERLYPVLRDGGLLCQIGVPLRLGPRVVGAVYALSETPGHYNEGHLQLLEFLGTQIAAAVQNAIQFGQTQSALTVVERQARYQTNVAQATALLSAQGTAALDEVLHLLGEAAQVGRSFYFKPVTDEQGDYWRLTHEWCAPGVPSVLAEPQFQRLPTTMTPYWLGELQRHGQVSGNTAAFPSPERDILESAGVRSVAVLAIPEESQPFPGFIGFVELEQERQWRTEELNALLTAAAALTNTLTRERLFNQVQMSLAETEALYQGGAALNVAHTYDEILAVLRKYTVLGREVASLNLQLFDRPWIGQQPPEQVFILSTWPAEAAMLPRTRYRLADLPLVLQKIYQSGESVIIGDVTSDPRLAGFDLSSLIGELPVRSILLIPLVVVGQRIGYLTAFYSVAQTFTETELRRLNSLSAQAAVVIQNIYQLQVTQGRARREQQIREITGQIQAAPDVQAVLQTALRELGRVLGTPRNLVQMLRPGQAQLSEERPDEPSGAGDE